MSTSREDMLALIRQRPSLRAAQISDLLDMELTIAESLLHMAVRDNQVVTEQVTAPNGLAATAYRIHPTNLGWVNPANGVAGTTAGPASPAPVSEPGDADKTPALAAQKDKPGTKVDAAIAHLAKNGPTDATALKAAIGLGYPVSQLLQAALADGRVKRDRNVYWTPDREPTNVVTAPPAPVPMAPAPLDVNGAGQGVIELLRAQLTPEEFRGFLKGSVIQHTLGGTTDRDASNYLAAGMYVKCLVEHTATI